MIQKNTLSSDHEWMEVIRVCRSSGLSVREWCRTSGISRNSLYYHIRKLRAMGYDPACLPGDGTCEQEVVPLAIVESGSLSNECRSSQMAGGSPQVSPSGTSASISITVLAVPRSGTSCPP